MRGVVPCNVNCSPFASDFDFVPRMVVTLRDPELDRDAGLYSELIESLCISAAYCLVLDEHSVHVVVIFIALVLVCLLEI